MDINQTYYVGEIRKPKGMQGELVAFLDTDTPENYADLEMIYIEKHQKLIPFFIKESQITGKYGVFLFEDINSLELANTLVGCALYLPAKNLPVLKGKSFYFHEVIGFTVETKEGKNLGILEDFLDYPNNLLFKISHESKKEILIPAKDEFIVQINREEKKIILSPIAGLVEMYLDEI